jgi:hypothetical protein
MPSSNPSRIRRRSSPSAVSSASRRADATSTEFSRQRVQGRATFSPRKMRLLHPCPTLQSCGDRTMSGVAQTAIPADVERPTSASVQETANVTKSQIISMSEQRASSNNTRHALLEQRDDHLTDGDADQDAAPSGSCAARGNRRN